MSDIIKNLGNNPDGMTVYEAIVNSAAGTGEGLEALIDVLNEVDLTGQFFASSARYLSALNSEAYGPHISRLIEGAIEKDRERRYIGSLLEAIWGADYQERAAELRLKDDNFRRIYKRIYPNGTNVSETQQPQTIKF